MASTPSGWRRSFARPTGGAHRRALLEVEVIGGERVAGEIASEELSQLCALAFASSGLEEGHVAIQFVDSARIRELNREHRARDAVTDVLSFPVDGADSATGPRELGDIVICLEHTADVREAVVHGALHLAGMDHEDDDGEMLALQGEIVRWASE
jgi:probable rRNA maturation factor